MVLVRDFAAAPAIASTPGGSCADALVATEPAAAAVSSSPAATSRKYFRCLLPSHAGGSVQAAQSERRPARRLWGAPCRRNIAVLPGIGQGESPRMDEWVTPA